MMRTRVKAGLGAGLAISLISATLFTFVQVSDLFIEGFAPSFGKRATVALRVPYGAANTHGQVTPHADAHRVFIPPGTLLNPDNVVHRSAVDYESDRRPPRLLSVLGHWVIFFIFSMAFTSYLRNFGQNRLRLLRAQVGVFIQLLGLLVAAKVVYLATGLSEFWTPVAAIPLWVAASYDRRTAIVVTAAAAFATASLLRFDLFVLSVGLAQGLAAILSLIDRKHSRAMIAAGAFGGVSSAALLVAMMFVLEGSFDWLKDLEGLGGSRLVGCLGGGVLSGLVAALFRSNAERLLGHVPRERLHDLTDLEQPLLKRMAQEAPGSWEHSRAMANLAEQAAAAISADALLVRVGAYYHDLGKSVRPKFFVENLGPDEPSPHNDLDPEVSTDAILAHVVEGTQILRDGGIPEPVVEFAYTHHGTQVVEYFWNKCKEQGNPKGLSEDYFRYPGMKPQTKETAILMLVDSIEAASRTVDPPDRVQFENMIQRIVFTKLGSGQLDESGLSMKDLSTIITRVADTLVNMNHHRIKYPWQAEKAEQFGVPSQAISQVPPKAHLGSTRPASDLESPLPAPPAVPVEGGTRH